MCNEVPGLGPPRTTVATTRASSITLDQVNGVFIEEPTPRSGHAFRTARMTPAPRPDGGDPEQTALPRRGRRPSAPRRPTILIADDTTDTRELYAEYFGSRGFTVVTAADGTLAIQAALDHQPDVIVMDLAMPHIDGITATRLIKADARTLQSRVILLTGYTGMAVERDPLGAGADLFVTKPCLPDHLERHVNRLRRRRAAPHRGSRLP